MKLTKKDLDITIAGLESGDSLSDSEVKNLIRLAKLGLWAEGFKTEISFSLLKADSVHTKRALAALPKEGE